MATTRTTRKAKATVTRKPTRPAPPAPAGPPDLHHIREQATIAVLQAVPGIIRGLIGKATEGNHLPAKFIFDFAGLTDTPAAAEADAIGREISLAELFLQKLQEMSNPAAENADQHLRPSPSSG
jgi:hypothetical protein